MYQTVAKAKETQLKRALETIARLKNQVTELQTQADGGTHVERSKVETLEARVKLLERQRGDLITAFKKQMKLIDVLKRQKVRVVECRTLSYSIVWCCELDKNWILLIMALNRL